MNKEYKHTYVEVGEKFLAHQADQIGKPKEFIVIRLGREVVLRSRGIGDVS